MIVHGIENSFWKEGISLERLEKLAFQWEKVQYNGACVDKSHCLQYAADIRILLNLVNPLEERR